jgi:nucleoside-diphosphate-sugar epimerase
MTKQLFIFGVGYAGLQIARLALREGWSVAGTATTEGKVEQLRAEGIVAELFAPPDFPLSAPFAAATHILSTIPPDQSGDPAVQQCIGCFRNKKPQAAWIGYLSTTGVYGDTGGAWVDETAAPRPGPARSRHRLAAERGWQALGREYGIPVHLFRLPAIYGPGRSALDQIVAGTARPVDKPGQVFCRIHVEDLARAVLASMSRPAPPPGAVYNVSDDEPAPQTDVIAFAARLLGRPVPPPVPYNEAAPAMSDMARSFYAENRRVRNDRVKTELGVALRYPTYREGLEAIRAGDPRPGNR